MRSSAYLHTIYSIGAWLSSGLTLKIGLDEGPKTDTNINASRRGVLLRIFYHKRICHFINKKLRALNLYYSVQKQNE